MSRIFVCGRKAAYAGAPVSCGGTMTGGSGKVFFRELDEAAHNGKYYERIRSRLLATENLTETEKAILCIPKIAEAEAARAGSEKDRTGWDNLAKMMKKWLAGPANTDKTAAVPFMVDMEWVLQYADAAGVMNEMKGVLYNAPALAALKNELDAGGMLTGQAASYNFIDVGSLERKAFSHQYRALESSYGISPDGLMASLGAFTFRGLSQGTVAPSGSGHAVTIGRSAVTVWDNFDFEGIQRLGGWSCASLEYAFMTGTPLSNADFRAFRERFGHGCDFHVVSDLLTVNDYDGRQYLLE